MKTGSVKDFDLADLKVIRRALSGLLWKQDHADDYEGRAHTARIYSRVSREVYRREGR